MPSSTSATSAKRIRKSPAARRTEIVGSARAVALDEGLESITLRRIADDLGVQPGLISHYFPAVEELVARAFGEAATAELDKLLPGTGTGTGTSDGGDFGGGDAAGVGADRGNGDGSDDAGGPTDGAGPTDADAPTDGIRLPGPDRPAVGVEAPPLDRLAAFFAQTTGEEYDAMSRLWLNARYLSRHRPALREQVLKQEELWRGRLVEVIGAGVEEGVFTTADPLITAIQILVVMDGLAAHANTDRGERPAAVNDLAATTAERELGLPRGTLAERARAMTLDAMAPDAMAPYTATA